MQKVAAVDVALSLGPGFVAGTGLSVLGACLLFIGQLALFTVFFTIGLLVSLVGTGFLL